MSLIRILQQEIPATVIDETELHLRAKSILPGISLKQVTHELLLELREQVGMELTTAFLYDSVLNRSSEQRFYKNFFSYSPETGKFAKIKGKVFIVPAGFYRELPEYAGDGSVVVSAAKKFGLESQVIPVRSEGRIKENSKIIHETLEKEEGNFFVFSFSKGGADFRVFLETYPHLVKKIKLWVSICGIHKGNPLADRLTSKSSLGAFFVKSVLNVFGMEKEYITDFSSRSAVLSPKIQVPKDLKTLSVVGFPIESHLKGTIRGRYKYLSKFGPNDGMTLLLDAILPHSKIIPVWGADHYFRTPKISNIIYQIFHAIHKGWI